MERRAEPRRLWTLRRFAILCGAALAGISALILQVWRFRHDPAGASVHIVALIVSLFIFSIQAWLILLQTLAPRPDSPSWRHHAHRASMKEAPLVALVGAALAGLLAVGTPALIFHDAPAADSTFTFQLFDPGTTAPAELPTPSAWDPPTFLRALAPKRDVPAPKVEAPRDPPVAVAPTPPRPEPRPVVAPAMTPDVSTPIAAALPKTTSIQEFQETESASQEGKRTSRIDWDEFWSQSRVRLDPGDAERFMRLGLPSGRDPRDLPPVNVTGALLMLGFSSTVHMSSGAEPFTLNTGSLQSGDTTGPGFELNLEFPLTPRDVLKIGFIGTQFEQEGTLTQDAQFGSTTVSAGETAEMLMSWAHVFAGLSHRFMGFTRESRFDFAIHAGAILDYTLTKLEVESIGYQAKTVDGEQGWGAPAMGVSIAFWSQQSGGLTLDILQSIPVNIGGQSVTLTDVRLGVQFDVSEKASFFFGYRRVMAIYRTYDEPLHRVGGKTSSEIDAGGPLFGLQIRI